MLENLKEKEALVLFRARVKDVAENAEDHFLLRWLRARNLDTKKAEEMLRNYFEWRKKNEGELRDVLYYIAPPHVSSAIPLKFIGLDYQGRPILWLPIGRWEVRRLFSEGHKAACFRSMYKVLEEIAFRIEEERKSSGLNQFVVLADSAQLSFWKVAHYETIEAILRFFREFEAYYPEYLHACYIVNNPMVFSYIFNLVKPLLSTHTLSKVQMFDHNQSNWKPALLKGIPTNVLPQEYGGTGDPVLSPA